MWENKLFCYVNGKYFRIKTGVNIKEEQPKSYICPEYPQRNALFANSIADVEDLHIDTDGLSSSPV